MSNDNFLAKHFSCYTKTEKNQLKMKQVLEIQPYSCCIYFQPFQKKVGGLLVEVRLVNIIFAEPPPHEPYNPK